MSEAAEGGMGRLIISHLIVISGVLWGARKGQSGQMTQMTHDTIQLPFWGLAGTAGANGWN